MKIQKIIAITLSTTALGIGIATGSTTANAYSQTSYIPKAIRGYYISPEGNLGLMITAHRIVQAIPASDASRTIVTHVNRSGHKYAIHGYENMGRRYYGTTKLSHYKKNRLYGTYTHSVFAKVSETSYYDFLNPFG